MAPDSGFDKLTSGIQDAIKGAFGQMIDYEPLSGGSFSIEAIFSAKHFEVDPDTEQGITSSQPVVGVKLSDMEKPPARGDVVRVKGVKYRVRDSAEDGEGWAQLFLSKV